MNAEMCFGRKHESFVFSCTHNHLEDNEFKDFDN